MLGSIPFALWVSVRRLKIRSTALGCPARTGHTWSGFQPPRGVNSKGSASQAGPRAHPGPSRPAAHSVQQKGPAGRTGVGTSLRPLGSTSRCPAGPGSGRSGPSPGSPGWRSRPPLRPLHPAPRSLPRAAPVASPGAGRCRLCRSLAGPRGAEDPTPLMPPRPPLHPRPVRPPLGAPGPRPPAPAPARAALAKVGVRAPPGRAPFAPAQPSPPGRAIRADPGGSTPRAWTPHHPMSKPASALSRVASARPGRHPGGVLPAPSCAPASLPWGSVDARWIPLVPGARLRSPPKSSSGREGEARGVRAGSLGLRVSRDPAGRAPGAERAPPPGPRRALGGRRVETAVGFSPGSWRRGRDAGRGVCECAEQTRG